jgi:hypothetical protein
MTQPIAPVSTVYCTDESICKLIHDDFAALAPHDQLLAAGTDGVFASNALWVLSSASANFSGQSVTVGSIVRLTGPRGFYKGDGNKYAVSSVSGGSVTLRNVGQQDAVGQPPGPIGGATGISFVVATFSPQIELVSYELNTKFGIDPNFSLISPDRIYDLRALENACALTVIVQALSTSSRTKDGDFAMKIRIFQERLSGALSICQVRWNQLNANPPPTNRFSTRFSR